MKLKTLSKAVIGLSTLTVSLTASAFNLPIPTGDSLFSDNSAEYLVNCTPGSAGCNSTSATDTTVDIGDRLKGIFQIDDISGQSILMGSGYDELSGVFDVTITNKIVGTDALGAPSYAYEFGVTPSFATDHGLSSGAAMAWYTDPTHEFTRETSTNQSVTDLENLITDGDLLWSTGFKESAFWNAIIGTDDIGLITAGNIAGGQFVMGLNYLDNNSGLLFADVVCNDSGSIVSVDQCANGGILSPNPRDESPFDVWDDVNFNSTVVPAPAQVVVPVPAAVWLFGSAMLGLVGVSKRRK